MTSLNLEESILCGRAMKSEAHRWTGKCRYMETLILESVKAVLPLAKLMAARKEAGIAPTTRNSQLLQLVDFNVLCHRCHWYQVMSRSVMLPCLYAKC